MTSHLKSVLNSSIMNFPIPPRTRAQESRAAIEHIYIIMRHLFIRGYYKPNGASGAALKEAFLALQPEIYGSMADPEKVELNGLVYVMDRLPRGIEQCRFVKLVAAEGYGDSGFEKIIPAKRRRNCYRIDHETMLVEVTRGRSEIYDILTHLTFMYVEANKIGEHALEENQPTQEWLKLEAIVTEQMNNDRAPSSQVEAQEVKERAFSYASTLLGRTYAETVEAYERFQAAGPTNNGFFQIIYGLGRLAMEETQNRGVGGQTERKVDRQISFSPALRERIGHHIHGEQWARDVKTFLLKNNLWERPLHIISANLHSILNSLFAFPVLKPKMGACTIEEMARELNLPENEEWKQQIWAFGEKHGMSYLPDAAGTNIPVQLFDTTLLPVDSLTPELQIDREFLEQEKPIILVMDYAFGEQAFEIFDELLKPYKTDTERKKLNVRSISVMGKAGTLMGEKGDLMIPTAHLFEGTADNYPFENAIQPEDFADTGLPVYKGAMITVLGTSLQNAEILRYFKESSWNAIGLEMEGAHIQKAIQSAAKIRRSIDENVTLRYAYYASDNPLLSGSTLASGSLGQLGIKPTYTITLQFLNQILSDS
ncbi:MAG: DUF6909 family protein [Halothece sp.]